MVLQKDDKAFCREVEGWAAARLPLPLIALALIEETVLGGSDELARPTAVIRVVGFVMSGQCHHGAMMKVVVPQGVEPVTAALRRARQLGVLRLVLSNDKGDSAAPRRSHLPRDGGDNMIFRSIENCLRRVEPQPVEMILVDPIARIGDEEFARGAGIGTVEIDRLTPFVVVAIGEISRGEQFEIVSVRAEMVVDDVEDDGDPESMGAVDEATKIHRSAVEPGWCEEVDAVISPAEPAREFRHGHNFEAGDTELRESRQLSRSGFPASVRGEGANMHLVYDELLARPPAPRTVGPSEVSRIDDFRRSVWTFRLKSRRRVGKCPFTSIKTKTIAHAGSRGQAPQ